MIILVFLSSYLPGNKAGGPIRTIANMVESLSDVNQFKIITYDRDLGDFVPYQSIIQDTWNRYGKAFVYYFRPAVIHREK